MTTTTSTPPTRPARPCTIGPVIATGAEGTVHECPSHPGHAVKLYRGKAPAELREAAEKVGAMVRCAELRDQPRLAWPLRVVTCQGVFAGFMMRKLDGVTLVPLSAEVARRTYLPGWTVRHVTRVVHDIAAICAQLERHGVFIVDVSLTNFLTRKEDALTSLIDADSLQFTTPTRHFPSRVFTPEFAPPEVLADPRRLARIGSAQARFTAALLFFQLYTHGSPYQVLEHRDLEPSQQIAVGRHFLGGKGVATGRTTPEIFARYRALPPRIAWLFKRAFIAGHRDPSARPTFDEWVGASLAFYRQLHP